MLSRRVSASKPHDSYSAGQDMVHRWDSSGPALVVTPSPPTRKTFPSPPALHPSPPALHPRTCRDSYPSRSSSPKALSIGSRDECDFVGHRKMAMDTPEVRLRRTWARVIGTVASTSSRTVDDLVATLRAVGKVAGVMTSSELGRAGLEFEAAVQEKRVSSSHLFVPSGESRLHVKLVVRRTAE